MSTNFITFTTSTSAGIPKSETTSSSPTIVLTTDSQVQKGTRQPSTEKALEAAVFAHIKAIRSLGRTSVNTAEIARALGISVSDVERTISALTARGVRVLG